MLKQTGPELQNQQALFANTRNRVFVCADRTSKLSLMHETGKSGVARVFFALWPDENCANRLHAIAENLVSKLGGKATRADTLHLTLAFVGNVNEDKVPDLIEMGNEVAIETRPCRADQSDPGFLILDHLACWKHNRILWAGCARCPALPGALADHLAAKLNASGYAVTGRPGSAFQPHITLVRKVRDIPGTSVLDVLKNAPISWPCQNFVLLRSRTSSQGVRYERLACWNTRTIDNRKSA